MTYYIFSIDPLFKKISEEYEIYQFLRSFYLKSDNILNKEVEYNNLISHIDLNIINNLIIDSFSSNKYYKNNKNNHYYNNKYRDEIFSIKVGQSVILIKTNHFNKTLFNSLKKQHLFVCNFKDQDYFWLNEFSC